jgi:hypothetical protein
MMKSDDTKQFWLLRRYLRQHKVPQDLTIRVLRYAEYARLLRKDLISESRVTLLSILSAQLQDELRNTVYFQSLLNHPLLNQVLGYSGLVAQGLCTSALQQQYLALGDVVFNRAAKATGLWMVMLGEVSYMHKTGTEVSAHEQDWMSEQVIWMEWTHKGYATAARNCEVILVKATGFESVMLEDWALHDKVASYARAFIDWMDTELRTARRGMIEVFKANEVGPALKRITEEAFGPSEKATPTNMTLADQHGPSRTNLTVAV